MKKQIQDLLTVNQYLKELGKELRKQNPNSTLYSQAEIFLRNISTSHHQASMFINHFDLKYYELYSNYGNDANIPFLQERDLVCKVLFDKNYADYNNTPTIEEKLNLLLNNWHFKDIVLDKYEFYKKQRKLYQPNIFKRIWVFVSKFKGVLATLFGILITIYSIVSSFYGSFTQFYTEHVYPFTNKEISDIIK